MNLLNKHDLPATIVAAVANDPYVGGGDISATKLIDAPQIRRLLAKHRDEIQVDVSERVWALLGQAVHTILERAGVANEGMVAEQRLFAEVNGWQVSGQFDVLHLESGTLSDYKVCSVFKAHGSDSWTRQMNVLRWLAHQNGYQIKALEIIAIFRDWRKTDALKRSDYPPAAIQRIPVALWDLDETEEYIHERVRMHQAASAGTPVPCTDEERWYSGDSYALIKPGGKRALRVASTREELGEQDGYVVEARPGVYRRCELYCDAAPFCSQWQNTPKEDA